MPPATKKPKGMKVCVKLPTEPQPPRYPKVEMPDPISSEQSMELKRLASFNNFSSISAIDPSPSTNAGAFLITRVLDTLRRSGEPFHQTLYFSPSSNVAISTPGPSSTSTSLPGMNCAERLLVSMRTIDDINEADLSRYMSSECTTFFIGPKRKRYLAHTALVCDLVPYFKAGPVSLEIFERAIDPEVFELFLIWIYRGPKALSTAIGRHHTFILLYALAEKWGCGALQNTVMDAIDRWISADTETGLAGYVRILEDLLATHGTTNLQKLQAFLQRTIVVTAVNKDVGRDEFFGSLDRGAEPGGSGKMVKKLLWEAVVMCKELPSHWRHGWAVHVRHYHV